MHEAPGRLIAQADRPDFAGLHCLAESCELLFQGNRSEVESGII